MDYSIRNSQVLLLIIVMFGLMMTVNHCSSSKNTGDVKVIKQGPFVIYPDSIVEYGKVVFSTDGESMESNYSGQAMQWQANQGSGEFPQLITGRRIVDAVYLLALESIRHNIVNGKFHAAADRNQLYTREGAFGIHLSAGLLFPRESWDSILDCVSLTIKEDEYRDPAQIPEGRNITVRFELDGGDVNVIYQDISKSLGGWPQMIDAISWAIGVWEFHAIYGLTKGDLQWVYRVLQNSLERPRQKTFVFSLNKQGYYQWDEFEPSLDPKDMLICGGAAFIDDGSGYPIELASGNGNRIARSKFLSTNALYYRGYIIAAEIGSALNRPIGEIDALQRAANDLKSAINNHLWLEDKGYFAYYKDDAGHLSDRMDALGHIFVALWDISDNQRIQKFMDKRQNSVFGIQLLAPRFPKTMTEASEHRFNGTIWPFVQAYWAWIASLNGRMDIFTQEFSALLRFSALNLNFKEFIQPENGQGGGSDYHFCAAAGFLSTVHHSLLGLNFSPEGIVFSPLVPAFFDSLELNNFPYRQAILNLKVIGNGTVIKKFMVDDILQDQPFLPSSIRNRHSIKIYLEEFD